MHHNRRTSEHVRLPRFPRISSSQAISEQIKEDFYT
jgi:hypothetical protein